MTTRVKWLCDGKRQIDRFGAWVRVTEGQISNHPTDQLRRVKEGVHYELAPLEVLAIEIEQKSPDVAPEGAETGKGEVTPQKAPSKKAASKKRGKRRIIKSKE